MNQNQLDNNYFMSRRWGRYICRENAYEKCVKVNLKLATFEWYDFQKRIVSEIKMRFIQEEVDFFPYKLRVEFEGFARMETGSRWHRNNPTYGTSGIPHNTRSKYAKWFKSECSKWAGKYRLILEDRKKTMIVERWRIQSIEYHKKRELKINSNLQKARDAANRYNQARRNQLAADQFFILAGAAQTISEAISNLENNQQNENNTKPKRNKRQNQSVHQPVQSRR